MNILRYRLLVFFFLFCPAAHSQVVHMHTGQGLQHIGQYVSYFKDSTARMTIDEVAAPGMQSHFRPSGRRQTNLNITYSVVWLHFVATSNENGPWCVQAEHPLTDDMQLYSREKGGWHVSNAGYNYPVKERELKSNGLVFPMNLQAGDTVDYYLRIQSASPIYIVLRVGTTQDFWMLQSRESLYYGIFCGIMLIMVLYNLFLYLTNREREYIYYVLYVICCTIFISFTNGYVAFFPDIFRQSFSFNRLLFPALFGFFGLLFTMRFLDTKKHAPRLNIAIYALMVMVLIAVIIDFFSGQASIAVIQMLAIVLTVLSLVIGFTVHRRGYAPARYYLVGFGMYLAGLTTYIVMGVSNIDTGNVQPYYILMAGSAIEAITLSFAIGDKLNMALRGKQAAQEEKMLATRENERIVREQNVMLEKKVEERTQEIQLQSTIIEEKNKDIVSSIHYAKRIQRALLASDVLLNQKLPEHFLLYKPKDIVSGDFYWAQEVSVAENEAGRFLLLTGDCTGHGVPGAFMSLLNTSVLHEIVVGFHISRPDLVLNAQRSAIIMALNPEGSEETSKDGMDAVLCSFDFQNKTLEFACANNPLWVFRKGEMLEYKADKQPIGLHEGEQKKFTLHTLQLEAGDIVYTFTDGFADQFGGAKGKKFKLSQLKELLLSIAHEPMPRQKEILETTFESWRGELEQVDDVLVIGVKIR